MEENRENREDAENRFRRGGFPVFPLRTEDGTELASECRTAAGFFQRFLGLMMLGKKDFPAGSALVFPACSSIHMCFMRMPIDVVYTDRNFTVTKTVRNLKPWRFSFGGRDTHYTFELPAGSVPESTVLGTVLVPDTEK